MPPRDPLSLYNEVSLKASAVIIRSYSTSFGLASRLLGQDVRGHVEAVYALVRIADEVVDGGAAAAGLGPGMVLKLLDQLEQDTEAAMGSGYSTNPVIHAFAVTARSTGITVALTRPFFESMRTDIDQQEHTADSFKRYVYGSAEVVGLMCLKCFLPGTSTAPGLEERLTDGAQRLGAAFQKVNFLRDLAEDFEILGRSYFPDIDPGTFGEADKHRILNDIDADLSASAAVLGELPVSSRRAVVLAHSLFAELAQRLRRTPAHQLVNKRVRVPGPVKLRIATSVLLTGHRAADGVVR